MLSHDLMDAWAHIDSPVHRLDARVALACAAVLVTAALVTPVAQNWLLAVHAGLLVAVAAASRLPARWLLKRMATLAPFLVLGTVAVALLPVADAADALRVGGVELSRQGLAVWVSVGGKCALSLLVAVLLTGTSTSAELLRAARAWRVPRTLTSLTGFAVTYITVLSEEAGRMITAMRSRGRVGGLRRKLRTGAAMVVTLMVRAAGRADRVAMAMVSRGYRGQMPALAQEPVPARHRAVGGAVAVLAGALVWAGMAA